MGDRGRIAGGGVVAAFLSALCSCACDEAAAGADVEVDDVVGGSRPEESKRKSEGDGEEEQGREDDSERQVPVQQIFAIPNAPSRARVAALADLAFANWLLSHPHPVVLPFL